jgi:hypothetical protein
LFSPYNSLEFVALSEITYVLVEHNLPIKRRIYTDGRDWPQEVEPTFQGYSIGRWMDQEGKGRFDVLEVETGFFKGPRARTRPASRPMPIISLSSRSASISIKPFRILCTMKLRWCQSTQRLANRWSSTGK